MQSDLILIGMPGSGKSTAGLLLARSLCCDFIDTDILLQKKRAKTLQEIINQHGQPYFLKAEEELILELPLTSYPSVIATGGSVVLSASAMQYLKARGIVIWLDVEKKELLRRLKNIHTRGIAMKAGQTIEDVLAERLPFYESFADFTVRINHENLEETVEKIIEIVGLDKCLP